MTPQKRDVLAILFPAVRGKLLRLLFSSVKSEHYVRELMLRSGFALHTVQDELRKLSALELIVSRSNGYHRFYRANGHHPLYSSIRRIVELSENLPAVRHVALRRAPSSRAPKKQRRRRSHLRPDFPINWGTLERVRRS